MAVSIDPPTLHRIQPITHGCRICVRDRKPAVWVVKGSARNTRFWYCETHLPKRWNKLAQEINARIEGNALKED